MPKKRGPNTLNGKPIVDATKPLPFKVTRRGINQARVACPMTCAIAKGLTRDKRILSVRIGQKLALVETKLVATRYAIRPEDVRKIRAFDKARYFEPGEYKLVPPPEDNKLGVHTVKHHRRKHGPRGTHLTRRPAIRHMWR